MNIGRTRVALVLLAALAVSAPPRHGWASDPTVPLNSPRPAHPFPWLRNLHSWDTIEAINGVKPVATGTTPTMDLLTKVHSIVRNASRHLKEHARALSPQMQDGLCHARARHVRVLLEASGVDPSNIRKVLVHEPPGWGWHVAAGVLTEDGLIVLDPNQPTPLPVAEWHRHATGGADAELWIGTADRSGERAGVADSDMGQWSPGHKAYLDEQDGLANLIRQGPPKPEPQAGRVVRAFRTLRHVGRRNMGPAPAALGAVAVGMAGYAVGGTYGAMGAGFVYNTMVGKLMAGRAMSWRMATAQGALGLLVGWAVDEMLIAAGYGENGFLRTVANIGAGSLISAGFSGYAAYQEGTTLGVIVGEAGWGFLSAALYGILVAEGMYHAMQWGEIYSANLAAMDGEPAMEDAMNEIAFEGGEWGGSWNPLVVYAYGVKTFAVDRDFSSFELLNPF